jgi:hypothetical protein
MFDVLTTASMRSRPTQLMEALYASAAAHGVDAMHMRSYKPRSGSTLVLYGLGGNDRLPHAIQHQDRGGHVVSWDAGYWDRKTVDRRYRISIDGFHCPHRIMGGENPGPVRWNASGLAIEKRARGRGDIILIGNGPKSGAVGAAGWAATKSREIREKIPGRRIVYRPKRHYIEPGVMSDAAALGVSIEKVLEQASLVVCRHSNVAVDACRLGIPVVCEDGAAAAIYPSRLEDARAQPSEETRREFLHRLAWWQWTESEIRRGDCWPWLLRQL